MEKLMEEKKTTLWQEIKICRVDETNYPHDLKKIKDRPEVLYYRGNIDILNEHKSIAVVGSRKISAVGAKLAYNAGSIIAVSYTHLTLPTNREVDILGELHH